MIGSIRRFLYNFTFPRVLVWSWQAYILRNEAKRFLLSDVNNKKKLDYNLIGSSLAIVVGGYMGDLTNLIYEKHGCNILVFEPHPDSFKECKKRFIENTKIRVFNYGLANTNDDLSLYDQKHESSFYYKVDNARSILCKIRRYSDVVKELGINKVDLMIINIEGGEYCLLEHIIQQNLISNIRNLEIQFHRIDSDSPAQRQKIVEQLSITHSRIWNYEFVWESWVLKSIDTRT